MEKNFELKPTSVKVWSLDTMSETDITLLVMAEKGGYEKFINANDIIDIIPTQQRINELILFITFPSEESAYRANFNRLKAHNGSFYTKIEPCEYTYKDLETLVKVL